MQCCCIISCLATITPLNYAPSSCLVKSILTDTDLGEGAARHSSLSPFDKYIECGRMSSAVRAQVASFIWPVFIPLY